LPFRYPTQYLGCGIVGSIYNSHTNYNSVEKKSDLTGNGQENYYCKVTVISICPYGGQSYSKEYLWQAGSSLTIKILEKTWVRVEVEYIEAVNICNPSAELKGNIWRGSYTNENAALITDIIIRPDYVGRI